MLKTLWKRLKTCFISYVINSTVKIVEKFKIKSEIIISSKKSSFFVELWNVEKVKKWYHFVTFQDIFNIHKQKQMLFSTPVFSVIILFFQVVLKELQEMPQDFHFWLLYYQVQSNEPVQNSKRLLFLPQSSYRIFPVHFPHQLL